MCVVSEGQRNGFDSVTPYWVDSSAENGAVGDAVDVEAFGLRAQICLTSADLDLTPCLDFC